MEKQNLKELFREIYRSPPSNTSTRSRRRHKKVELPEGLSSFTHIYHNDFVGRKPKKVKDDDVAICFCKCDPDNPESACGDGCLNVMTSTECIRGYCPCQDYCKNQRFQNCEYAKTKLFQIEGHGWGLLADEDIQAGQFIIEYCGEVISLEEAKHRSQSYEAQGLKDAYIISLNSNYFIDATKKGSLARFINHSCLPTCETRKWTVLGEIRVGMFAKVDISSGTELSYNYNFEWYGGATVCCLCRAANCCLFLGAKSQGFQEYNHVWEEGDDRVEKVPLHDSAKDEPLSRIPETISPFKFDSLDGLATDYSQKMEVGDVLEWKLDSSTTVMPHNSVQVDGMTMNTEKVEVLESGKSKEQDMQQAVYQMRAVLSGLRIDSASQNFDVGSGSSSKKKSDRLSKRKKRSTGGKQSNTKNIADLFQSKEAQEDVGSNSSSKKKSERLPKQKKRSTGGKQSNTKNIADLFPSKEAQKEVRKYEKIKNQAAANLKSVYDEIRPAIKTHGRDSQDSIPSSVETKWVGAHCAKYKADLNFSVSVIKNFLDIAHKGGSGSKASGSGLSLKE
ncbi:histone-lysine N-methyltransferase ASHH1-like isoform X2 [Coffea arabica]|uniref:Histone-lysine N-methyltransferase ASHH1-like isoform X2 n=1 Tax=Coffea arabica TaxID=13443 RepID=A0ABM4X600_COFAR